MYADMRGDALHQGSMYSYISLEERIPQDHRLRSIRKMVNQALEQLSSEFDPMYSQRGRPSIPPEHLIRALLLQLLYGLRSEAQLMEQIRYNLLFRWFVGLEMDDEVWDATVFTKNRDRLLKGNVAQRLLQEVLEQARAHGLLSEEHFTVDGTLLEAWANRRSFQEKDPKTVVGTGWGGSKLLRDTHQSTTDPESRLYKKSTAGEAEPSYLGHVVIENRHGLVVAACATQSSTTAEREAALKMLEELGFEKTEPQPNPLAEVAPRATLGADKLYQDPSFVRELRKRRVVPHIAEYESGKNQCKNSLQPAERESAGFKISQRKRKLVEMVFGWGKLSSIMRQMKLKGRDKVDWLFRLLATANNLVRLVQLIPAQ
jgi:transposase